ncbi:MAG: ABC transporter permease subunit [bacterium]
MITLIKIELMKIFRKWRTYIGFLALGVLIPIVQIAMYYEGQNSIDHFTRSLSQSFVFVGNLLNGYFVGNLILQALFIHIPFLIVLVGGDLLAGESTAGTYRMLITRPISRFQIITSKYIAGIIYTLLLLMWLAILSLGVSIIIFGTGPLVALRDTLTIFAADDVLWRFGFSYGYAALSMMTVFGLAFLFSSLVENAIGPIVASMAIIIIFIIISALPIEALDGIKPFLFTNYMDRWRDFMNDPIDYRDILKSAAVLIAHIVGFYLITLYLFIKKDILS